jgi:hypothetical protein
MAQVLQLAADQESGSRPASSRSHAVRAEVVVLPCVPVITIELLPGSR